jgi:cell division protein FtsN
MERANTYQLELFTAKGESGALKPRVLNNPFLSYIHAYEKTILIIIGIVITGIVSFSFGVESGKRSVAQKGRVNFDMALNVPQAQPVKQPVVKQVLPQQPALKTFPVNAQAPIPAVENKGTISVPAVKSTIENYTIQVASYKSKTYAQKEAQALKKQGFVTLTLSKGNYIVLCVGNFNSKEKAQSFVSQLKKRYQGCTIRRL